MKRDHGPHDLLVALLLVQNTMQRRSDSFFQAYGLTDAQFNILNLLGHHEGRMDQAVLVERLLVGKSSISIVLNRMVRDGLVKRAEHAEDRRQTVLTLTGKGQTLWRKLSPLYEALVGEIFGAVPNKQRSGFINNLDLLYAALKNEDEEIPAPSLREHLARLASDSKTRKPPLAS